MQLDPVSEIENCCYRQSDDFNGHRCLIQLELGCFNDVKRRQKTEVIKHPIEREERIDKNLHQPPILILARFPYQLDNPRELLNELGQSHKLPRLLQMIFANKTNYVRPSKTRKSGYACKWT